MLVRPKSFLGVRSSALAVGQTADVSSVSPYPYQLCSSSCSPFWGRDVETRTGDQFTSIFRRYKLKNFFPLRTGVILFALPIFTQFWRRDETGPLVERRGGMPVSPPPNLPERRLAIKVSALCKKTPSIREISLLTHSFTLLD